ncbi:putative ribonuclease H-like domain-containing protein [Tanacetum coccineum]
MQPADPIFSQNSKDSLDVRFKPSGEEEKKDAEDPGNEDSEVTSTIEPRVNQEKDVSVNSINTINTVSPTINTADIEDNVFDQNIVYRCDDDPNMSELEEIVYSNDDEDVGAEADINNLDTHIPVIPIPTTRIHKDHPVEQITGDIYSAPQTTRMIKSLTEQAMFKGVYVCQPPGFEDLDFPDRVYKVEKALYGLHQARRAWYETLLTYLLDNGFQRGKIDKTLFIKRDKSDILLVQVYVDDIIFGSTRKKMCTEFEKMMHKKFQMSSMGELTFFLGLQVTQKDDGLDRKSTTGGCQFLGCRLILWQCKKQIVVANSTTEAEYIAASNCCGQVKTVNEEVQIQALVDKKKAIIRDKYKK